METRKELAANKKLKQSRAQGALCGLAIGDSFGDASRTDENHKKFGITMDFDEGSSWSTDDTEFALLTAKTLIKTDGELTPETVVEEWLDKVVPQNELYRGGGSEIEAAVNLKRGLRPPQSGQFNSYYMSDGAAMRIAPVGIICAGDPEMAAKKAKIDASISHWREGIWGAQAVAAALSVAMVGGSVDQIVDAAYKVIPEDTWFYYTFTKAQEICEKAGTIEKAWHALHTEFRTTYKAVVPEAITQAFAVFKLMGSDFVHSVIYSGNFGRDADTIGAVVGSLSGALNGIEKIPERWVEKTRYPTGTCLQFTEGLDIMEIGSDLAKLIK